MAGSKDTGEAQKTAEQGQDPPASGDQTAAEPSEAESETDRMLDEAMAHHHAGRYAEAEDGYRLVLEREPENANALNLLGIMALEAGYVEDAIDLAERATRAAPSVGAFHANLGTAVMEKQEWDRAERSLVTAHLLGYGHVQVPFNLGLLYMHQSRTDKALEAFREVLKLEPDKSEAEFLVAALSGEQRESAPLSYVVNLFDSYASGFERHVTGKLEYRVPEDLRAMVAREAPDADGWRVVDIGAGTGLCGAAFRDLAGYLAGCDVSPRMVSAARARGIYDDMAIAELSQYLAERSDIDLVVAADVFIYVGALEDAMAAIAAALRSGGYLAFSAEAAAGDRLELRTSGRFAHSQAYLSNLAGAHGFDVVAREETVIRKEAHSPVEGHLHLWRRA